MSLVTRETVLNAIISGTLRDDYENHSEDQQEGTEMSSEKAKIIEVTAQIMKVLSDAYAEKVMLYASSLQTIQEEREEAEGGKR